MTLKAQIEAVSRNPADLERLFRTAQAEGNETAFRDALVQCQQDNPGDVLLEAWLHRLELPVERPKPSVDHGRHWWSLIGASVVIGVATALLAGRDFPPEADGLFWVGWGPLVAVGLLIYLARSDRSTRGPRSYIIAAVTVVVVALYSWFSMEGVTEDVGFLRAAHVSFMCWTVVGAALCLGYPSPAKQSFSYLVKSVEAILTGGIFFGAGLIFVGLTFGIFAVLGIELPESNLRTIAAWGLGAIPLLAIGSAYDVTSSPAAQDWHAGLTRTLRILARLLLPLALGVLVVYVLWFIPVYFRKPFEEREVLIVYNATILAIMVLLTVVVSGPLDVGSLSRNSFFRYAVLGLGGLTLILNAYALAAVLSRTIDSGLTPNRFAVIGWNITTLLILGSVGVRLWTARREPWMAVFRESIGLLAPLAAVWVAVLLGVLPFI